MATIGDSRRRQRAYNVVSTIHQQLVEKRSFPRPNNDIMSSGSPLRRSLRRRRQSSDGRTFSDMSCARTPSWNSQGDHPRRRRRFGAAFLTVVFELPLSDVTVVDGEKAVLDCRHGYVVRRHVVHDARSAHRHRLLSDEVSDMTRSSVTLPWLAPTPDDGAAIVAYVIRAARTPVTDVDARRAGQAAVNRLHSRQPPRTSRETDSR